MRLFFFLNKADIPFSVKQLEPKGHDEYISPVHIFFQNESLTRAHVMHDFKLYIELAVLSLI
jgi:hypothetical protein